MSFLRRVFSRDHRAARAAEAAGNVDLAAERYALAGDPHGAVRMHLARAVRAADRNSELAALRDALHWAGDVPELRVSASAALGRALWAKASAEGVATARDKDKAREAAALLIAGREHELAGQVLEKIGDLAGAAQAFSAAGEVEHLERALSSEDARSERQRQQRDAYASYQTHMHVGRRDDARAELSRCIASADNPAEYQRLLDQLETQLITGGRVELKRRAKPAIIVASAPTIVLGRDAISDLPVRAAGISRRHAEILVDKNPPRFMIRDAESRNGTRLSGLPLDGAVPLAASGELALGDDCRITYQVVGEPGTLVLTITSGIDRGVMLLVAPEGQAIDLAAAGVPCDVVFGKGRPFWRGRPECPAQFNGEPLGAIRVQLIRGDRLTVGADVLDVG
jgi:tetratricopeptide (TPR) repeat protein